MSKISKVGLFVLLMLWGLNLFMQNTLSSVSIEAERLDAKVKSQKETNQALTMKINELASFENINGVANKSGLAYNNSNIRIISK